MSGYSGKNLYQIKITLDESKPPIWRRLVVPKKLPLNRLHSAIQLAMGWDSAWQDYHLYRFQKGQSQYQEFYDDESYNSDTEDTARVPLKKLLGKEGDKILYEYDFGAGWDHEIILEKSSMPDEKFAQLPICIDGAETCPAEDSGGMWGYYEKLKAVKNVNCPYREEEMELLERDIDRREYDLEAINKRLTRLRIKRYIN